MRKILPFTFFVLYSLNVLAQSDNVDCASAFTIPDPIEWCSGNTEFDNTNAGPSEFAADQCLSGTDNDLWFTFIAFAKAVNIVVNGDLGGSINNPAVALYTGDCNGQINLLRCEVSSGQDIVNLFRGGLTLGETYFIRIAAPPSGAGSFQICLNGFNPPVEPGQDAETASNLCDKSSFIVQVLSGGGNDPDEASGTCLDIGFGDTESQSTWFTWIAANDGQLTFSINPLNGPDDLDWVLYELPNGIDDFTGKINIRCMASSCIGPTGLDLTSTDFNEQPGCAPGDDNFLRFLDQEEGKAYGLLINNFTDTGVGFEMEFGGDAEFEGPLPEFEIDLAVGVDTTNGLTCDKLFQVTDLSIDGLNSIVAYEWNFGEGAVPQTATGQGPHSVNYETFGEKYVVLTVTSEQGCIVTAVDQVFAAPCCEDVDAISIELDRVQASGCEGETNGSISVSGAGGFPVYLFSFEGGELSSLSTFEGLAPGDYEIAIEDRKGCVTTRMVTVGVAAPISVDAGNDTSVEFLGDPIQLDASFMAEGDVTLSWTPSESVLCPDGTTNCLDPIVTPPGTTTYTISLLDENGCVTTDMVTVEVLRLRPVFTPNVFSPNQDGFNDFFYIFGSPLSVLAIQEFVVFDRWGNKVYTASNLQPNDMTTGWDGNFNGNPADQGVYTWFARVLYLDTEGEEGEIVTGDVTLVR